MAVAITLSLLVATCLGKVVVNEVFVWTGNGTDQVEFYNDGDAAVSLEGYFWTDDVRNFLPNEVKTLHTYYFKAEDSIDAKGYLMVDGPFPFGLARSDEVHLYNKRSEEIDFTKWRNGQTNNNGTLTWSRCNSDNNNRLAFQTQPATPLADNTPMCSDVKLVEPNGTVVITEVSRGAFNGGDSWVEFYNPSLVYHANLTGWYLTDQLKAYYYATKLPDVFLAPDTYLVVTLDQPSDRKLGSTDEVHLFDGNMTEVDEVHWTKNTYRSGSLVSCETSFRLLKQEGWKDWSMAATATQGAENANCPERGDTDLVVSEVAASTPSGLDWIEFQNIGSKSMDFVDWRFGDRGARWSADGMRVREKNTTTTVIAPGAFFVIDMTAKGIGFDPDRDAVNLFNDIGQIVQSTGWNESTGPLLGTSWARCDNNGVAEYYTTKDVTKGTANVCTKVVRMKKTDYPARSPAVQATPVSLLLFSLALGLLCH